jgi:ubiquinone/menaquinone biosynthesis C-methylase UbiE
MSATQSPVYAAPFDAVALQYDDMFTSSAIGAAQRAAVWKVLATTFQSGDRVLEIGCGTGVDACFMAERGVQVVACDSSSQMIAVASRRIREKRLQNLVQTLVLPAEQLSNLPSTEKFDGAFSNFGAMNCVEDLSRLAKTLAERLKPGATALLCWMGHLCAWEIAWYLAHGNRRKAFRRLNRNGVSAKIADGASVQVRYPTTSEIARQFAPQFRVKSVHGIGVAVPPSYVEAWARRHPRLLSLCQRADTILGCTPGLRNFADHILVRLERSGSNEAGRR